MPKCVRFSLILIAFLSQQQYVQAGPLGVAGEYNIFVFNDIVQMGTDAEGRVAAGGNVTFGSNANGMGFAVASKIQNPNGLADLVAGKNVTLANGSVGYLEPGNPGSAISRNGTISYGGTANVAGNVGYGALINASPIDFAQEQNYLISMSQYWGGLVPNGTSNILRNASNEIYEVGLTGSDSALNIFELASSDIGQNMAFKFSAPSQSTVLVNVTGANVDLMNFGFYFNGIEGNTHSASYPYRNILFNFLDATDINIDQIEINGSILAPWAHIDFGKNSHIDGTLVASSLTGEGESHNFPFQGAPSNLPFQGQLSVPEPTPLALLALGFAALAFSRRKFAA